MTNKPKKILVLFLKAVFVVISGLLVTWLNNYFNEINFWKFFVISVILPLVHLFGYSFYEGMDAEVVKWKYFWFFSMVSIIVFQVVLLFFP